MYHTVGDNYDHVRRVIACLETPAPSLRTPLPYSIGKSNIAAFKSKVQDMSQMSWTELLNEMETRLAKYNKLSIKPQSVRQYCQLVKECAAEMTKLVKMRDNGKEFVHDGDLFMKFEDLDTEMGAAKGWPKFRNQLDREFKAYQITAEQKDELFKWALYSLDVETAWSLKWAQIGGFYDKHDDK